MKTSLFLLNLSVLCAGLAWQPASASTYPPEVNLDRVRDAVSKVRPSHPRLLATADQLQALKRIPHDDSTRRALANHSVREADALLDRSPITRTLEGRRLLGQSRRCVERVLILATAYHLTGDDRYVARCEQEMLAAAAFTDWNPDHFLDVGEMTFALAMGYDWLFDALSPDTRAVIRAAIVDKALKLPFETRHKGWVRARNNWGQVCHGGLTAGALAILEDEPDLAARTVHNALMNVPLSMEAYAPKGSYPEGPGYWAYGTSYNVILIAELDSVFGTDFGLSAAPGFDQTGQYPALVTGPSGATFNYADGGSGRGPQPILFWFAHKYERNDWLHGEVDLLRNRMSRGGRLLPLALLWMDDSPAPEQLAMPLHWYGDGHVPISIHRTSWTDPNAVFLGFKGGSPSANHGNMDIGSFVLDADGVRWSVDLGAEGYHGIESRGMNLWDRSQDSDRWTIFRQMNHGHSTLVIDDHLQKASAFGRFESFSDDTQFPHSIIDMSPVYEGDAQSVRRGVALLPSQHVLIRDEIAGLRAGAKVRWGMITPATAGKVGPEELELCQGDARLQLRQRSSVKTAWQIQDISQPRKEWDSPNRGISLVLLEAVAPADGRLTFSVLLQPGSVSAPMESAMLQRPLDLW